MKEFDPKDIGKEPRPTIEQLLLESSGVYDDNGKDMTNYQYGRGPEKQGEDNPNWKGGISYDRHSYYHNRKVLLSPEEREQRRNTEGLSLGTDARGDNGDISGENNPNWKGGVCKDMKKYRREYYQRRKAA
tara:strand:- start:131 stop:523 length:393 start_codon:yes stop_codon:yes gene_type:complete